MPKSWVCSCGARNNWLDLNCEACGREKAEQKSLPESTEKQRRCPIDGSDVRGDGLCLAYSGYPEGMSCPIVCPTCSGKLTWSGVCFSSHAYADRIIPGDRYELNKGHWLVAEKGPRMALTQEQNLLAIRVVSRVFRGELDSAEGHRLIDEIARG